MKEVFKTIILESQQRNFSEVKSREQNIPINVPLIVSLIGTRRSGKTYMLYDVIRKLRSYGVAKQNIIYINFEDERLQVDGSELDFILQGYYELYPKTKIEDCYFLFDEIQNINGWEKFVRRIFDSISKKIFITGSNAKLLSTEIATSLRGRTITYTVYPLQLKEYLYFQGVSVDFYNPQKKALMLNHTLNFIKNGGFPEVLSLDKPTQVKVLQSYYNTMIYRDIVERYKIADPLLLKYFIRKIIASVSKPLSINKIYKDLKSQGYKISNNYLYQFEEYCETIFLTIAVPKFDFSEIKQAKSEKKTYCIDTGLISSLEFSLSENLGKLFENMVLLELLKMGKEVFYFKDKYECDFIVKGDKQLQAIQVSFSIDDTETWEREIRGLLEACQKLNLQTGTILTFDKSIPTFQRNNITINTIPICDYLLKQE